MSHPKVKLLSLSFVFKRTMLKTLDLGYSFLFFTSLSASFLVSISSLAFFNLSVTEAAFSPAPATWYGDPTGAGIVGGACGYRYDVKKPLFSAVVSAGNENLFKQGKGCGACYEWNRFWCNGKVWPRLLRKAGVLKIEYRRVACNYPNMTVIFTIDEDSNPSYFACVIEHEKGDGDLSAVELQVSVDLSNKWLPMQQFWGATWRIDLPVGAKGPFSIRLTTLDSSMTILANNVIPADWTTGKSHSSLVNFD